MAEREFQAILAQLCVNDATRLRFLSGDETDLSAHALSEAELSRLRVLRRTGAKGLTLFARILGEKRRACVRSLLPHAAAYLTDDSWAAAWVAYTSSGHRGPPLDSRSDAVAFAFFATHSLRLADPVAVELLEYDATFNAVAVEARASTELPPMLRPNSFAEARRLAPLAAAPRAMRRISCDVATWLASRTPQVAPPPAARGGTVLFFRPFGAQCVRTATVGQVAAALLDRAYGISRLDALLALPSPRLANGELDDHAIWKLIGRLREARALCFVEARTARGEESC
jgi:hypothetical protein